MWSFSLVYSAEKLFFGLFQWMPVFTPFIKIPDRVLFKLRTNSCGSVLTDICLESIKII